MAKLNPRPEAADFVRQAARLVGDHHYAYSCNALNIVLANHPEKEHLEHLYRGLFLHHPWFFDRANNPNMFSSGVYSSDEKRADRVLALHMFANMLEKGTLP